MKVRCAGFCERITLGFLLGIAMGGSTLDQGAAEVASGDRPAQLVNASGTKATVFQSGQFQFELQGRAQESYLIQASTNLVDWTVIATNEATQDGTGRFTDAQYSTFAQRFYRGLRLTVSAQGFRDYRVLVKPKPGIDLALLNLRSEVHTSSI